MQPAAQGIVISHGFGPSRQDEKRGLKGVFGEVGVSEQSTADTQDHRSVPLDEGGKRRFRARTIGRKIMVEQLAVGQGTERSSLEQRADVLADAGVWHALVTSAGPLVATGSVGITPLLRQGLAFGSRFFMFRNAAVDGDGFVGRGFGGSPGSEDPGYCGRPRWGQGVVGGCFGLGSQGLEAPGYCGWPRWGQGSFGVAPEGSLVNSHGL